MSTIALSLELAFAHDKTQNFFSILQHASEMMRDSLWLEGTGTGPDVSDIWTFLPMIL